MWHAQPTIQSQLYPIFHFFLHWCHQTKDGFSWVPVQLQLHSQPTSHACRFLHGWCLKVKQASNESAKGRYESTPSIQARRRTEIPQLPCLCTVLTKWSTFAALKPFFCTRMTSGISSTIPLTFSILYQTSTRPNPKPWMVPSTDTALTAFVAVALSLLASTS